MYSNEPQASVSQASVLEEVCKAYSTRLYDCKTIEESWNMSGSAYVEVKKQSKKVSEEVSIPLYSPNSFSTKTNYEDSLISFECTENAQTYELEFNSYGDDDKNDNTNTNTNTSTNADNEYKNSKKNKKNKNTTTSTSSRKGNVSRSNSSSIRIVNGGDDYVTELSIYETNSSSSSD